MNIDELEKLRAEVESKFNEKKSARDNCLSQADSLLEEMHKLQGEYAAYTTIIDETNKSKPKVKVKGE